MSGRRHRSFWRKFVVSFNRCDAIIAKASKLSRTRSTELFHAGKIFVNGRQYDRNSGILKSGDIVSVRGFAGNENLCFVVFTETKRKDPCGHCEICVRLWECKARSNPCNQSLGVLTPKSYHAGKQKNRDASIFMNREEKQKLKAEKNNESEGETGTERSPVCL